MLALYSRRADILDHLPHRSSPLSISDTNVHTESVPYKKPGLASMVVEPGAPFSQRVIRPNPFLSTSKDKESGRHRQRDLFLSKIRRDGEERKWQSRGEELLRLDFFSLEKRWRANLARTAPPSPEEPDEEIQDSITATQNNHMVEDVQQYEHQELEVLLSSMESSSRTDHLTCDNNPAEDEDDTSRTIYGSDDEDYESIFMDIIQRGAGEDHHHHSKGDPQESDHLEDMDMSNG